MLLPHAFLSVEAKKNLIQKRKKEKLPVDIVPSSEETTCDRSEQVVTVEMDVTQKTAEPEADICPTAQALSSKQGVCIGVLTQGQNLIYTFML